MSPLYPTFLSSSTNKMALPWASPSALPLITFEVGDRIFVQGITLPVKVMSVADDQGWYSAKVESDPMLVDDDDTTWSDGGSDAADDDMEAGVAFRFNVKEGCIIELESGKMAEWKPVDKNSLLHDVVQTCVDAAELRPGIVYPSHDDLASKLESFLKEMMRASEEAAAAQGANTVSKEIVEDVARAVMKKQKNK